MDTPLTPEQLQAALKQFCAYYSEIHKKSLLMDEKNELEPTPMEQHPFKGRIEITFQIKKWQKWVKIEK